MSTLDYQMLEKVLDATQRLNAEVIFLQGQLSTLQERLNSIVNRPAHPETIHLQHTREISSSRPPAKIIEEMLKKSNNKLITDNYK